MAKKEKVIKRCHDCGVKMGQFHKPGCDMEECPFCHNQLISCDCCYEHLSINFLQEPVFSKGLNKEQQKKWDKLLHQKGLIPYGSETRFRRE